MRDVSPEQSCSYFALANIKDRVQVYLVLVDIELSQESFYVSYEFGQASRRKVPFLCWCSTLDSLNGCSDYVLPIY